MNINKIIILFFLLNTLTIVTTKMSSFNYGIRHKVRNTIFAFIIFREKKMHKLCNIVKNALNTYHNKSIVTVADGYFSYNELSEEDKIIIETIIGMCY